MTGSKASSLDLERLLASVKGTYAGLGVRFSELEVQRHWEGLSVSSRFFYPSFRQGEPDIEAFAKYLYGQIVPFTLPRRIRQAKEVAYQLSGDLRHLQEMFDQARHLFVRARDSKRLSGEAGELALFVLLEGVVKAPQVACKMYLKTSENMPVHGTDGIHVMPGPAPDGLTLLWGESKLHKELGAGMDAALDSIKAFLEQEGGRSPRDRDIAVLLDHADAPDDASRKALLSYLDPYEQDSVKRHEAHAVFIGFDYSAYSNLLKHSVLEREQLFRDAFNERISTACELFAKKIKDASLPGLQFLWFLMPFPSVDDLRKRFAALIEG